MEDIYKIAANGGISDAELKDALKASLEGRTLQKVLIIPPDFTRFHSQAGKITSIYYQLLTERGVQADIMPALGTHEPVSKEQWEIMFKGIPYESMIVHDWRHDVVKIGEVPASYLEEITDGLWHEPVSVEINRRVMDESYDLIISPGQVVPHEVIGMANHSKNLFVGVGGSDMINKSHMVGAVYGMERMMGKDHTPVRKIFDYGMEHFLSNRPILFVLTVCTAPVSESVMHGLFIGEGRSCLTEAVKLAQEKNIDFVEHGIQKCVVYLDPSEFKSTTDDPADTLEWHKKIAADPTIPFRVLPSFRPDNYLGGDLDAERTLCEKYGTGSLPEALEKALDYFCENGCKVSDHGFSRFAYIPGTKQAELLHFLGKAYYTHGVAMQLHLGPIRNQNPRLLAEVGPDAGGDSVGLTTDPFQLGAFLGDLARENSLPNTILYNLNPTDNAVLSTMAVNFAPKVQFGAAWWFNDTIRGMRRQIDELMENGLLAKSVGMLTDSRSFSSFPRHEYYRRILCQRLGELAESGQYPADERTLGQIVENICGKNAAAFLYL